MNIRTKKIIVREMLIILSLSVIPFIYDIIRVAVNNFVFALQGRGFELVYETDIYFSRSILLFAVCYPIYLVCISIGWAIRTLRKSLRPAPTQKYESTVFCHQFPIVKTFLQHAVYYRLAFASYIAHQIKDEYWTATINAHCLQAIINWCMVFGADGCNQTHWKNLAPADTTNLVDDFRKKCLASLQMTRRQWDAYWKEVTTFRNEYAAHRQIDSRQPVPILDTALKIAHFYDNWIREVIAPDVLEEPRLHISEREFTNNAKPLIEALMTETKRFQRTTGSSVP